MNYLTSEQNNPADNLKEIYNSEYCITLDELPDLKSYPITSEPDDAPAAGDVNLDGKVDISDAVLLNKTVAGTISLSESAQKNADCDGDGETGSNDAVVLLRFLVHLIQTLPSTE